MNKKRLPSQVTIAGQSWQVKIVNIAKFFEDESIDVTGMTVYDPLSNTRLILIDESVPDSGREHVFYHELFHAIVASANLPAGTIEHIAEEVLAETFALWASGQNKKPRPKTSRGRVIQRKAQNR